VDRIKIEAGYENTALEEVFLGEIDYVRTDPGPPTSITQIEIVDGKSGSASRMYRSFARGTTVGTILRNIAKATLLDKGNLESFLRRSPQIDGMQIKFPMSVHGRSVAKLNSILEPHNIGVSVQQGQLQLLENGKSLGGEAILLNATSGMIASPSLSHDNIVTVQCLLLPGLAPGVQIIIDSLELSGRITANRVLVSGDSRTGILNATVEGKLWD
jgi:hypothetical protein